MVEHSPAMIEALEDKGYDVGFVGEHNEAGVYVDDAGEARLRAEGYKIGETVEDDDDLARPQGRDREDDRARGARRRGRPPRPHRGGQGQGRGRAAGRGRDHARLHVHELRRALPLRRGAQRQPRLSTPARRCPGPTPVPTARTARSVNFGEHRSCPTAATPRAANKIRDAAPSVHVPPRPDRAAGRRRQPAGLAGHRARGLEHRRAPTRAPSPSGPAGPCRRASRPSRRTSSRSTWTRPRPTAGWTRSSASSRTSSRRSRCRTRRTATSVRAWR